MEPTQEVIDRLKAQFSTRSLHRVDLTSDIDDPIVLIMTGPNAAEYEKFVEDIQRASEQKNENDRMRSMRSAVQNNALAQIRWPERTEVVALFDRYPAMALGLAKQLHSSAGDAYEVRSKKL
jgi:hypothetical protein